jgi:CDP-glycerol glycerophosphotransferase (TagB/SpsB family)
MHAGTRDPAIDLSSIRWERVQLVIEARVAPAAPLDPGRLRLSEVGGRRSMAPTRIERAEDRLTVHYNVITGLDRDRLPSGRWALGVPVTLDDPSAAGLHVDGAGRSFLLEHGLFTVAPAYDGASRTLALVASVDETVQRRADLSVVDRVRMAGRWLGIHARRLGFLSLIRASRLTRRDRRPEILFASALISELSGNLGAVHDRMVERGLDRDYELVTALRPPRDRRGFLGRVRLASALDRATVVLLDDSYPPLHWLKIGPSVRVIQMWHAAGAFKTVGYSRVGTPTDADRFARVHRKYTAAIVSSEHDVPFYAEAFGIPEEIVFPTGIPRMDRFFDERSRVAGLAAARAAFPETDGRTTILYAPTFRGDGPKSSHFDLGVLDYAGLHAVAVDKDAVVIIKLHPFVVQPLGIPAAFADRLLDGSRATIDVNDLLFAVDLLITDYSSIVFEFSTLGRPMLFYAYDLDDYVGSRDFYVPFQAFVPGRIVRTFPEVLDAIRRDDYEAAKVAQFAVQHFAHLDAGSADRVIDQLVLPR